jgi:hypothetical protein
MELKDKFADIKASNSMLAILNSLGKEEEEEGEVPKLKEHVIELLDLTKGRSGKVIEAIAFSVDIEDLRK